MNSELLSSFGIQELGELVEIHAPRHHTPTDLLYWHQYQGQATNDCAAFSIAIVGNAYLNRWQFDGYSVAREMEQPQFVSTPLPHLALWKIPGWATLPWGISGYLKHRRIPARLRCSGRTERLLRNIQENRFTIVIVGEPLRHEGLAFTGWAHAKVLYGYEPSGPEPARGFYFVDPASPKAESRSGLPQGVLGQDEVEFEKQWRNMLGLYVELTED